MIVTVAAAALLSLSSFTAAGLPPFVDVGEPQVPDPVAVFFAAQSTVPVGGVVDGGVLVCRVDIVGDHGWDTFGAVDLAITITLGQRAPTEVWGPEDRSSAVVSVPGVDLKPGTRVVVDVDDRDVTGREAIARGAVVYAGQLPLRLDLNDAQVECRVVDRATAVARAAPALAQANKATAVVAAARVDLVDDGLGLPRDAWFDAARHAGTAAAWLGSRDDGVEAARSALQAALRAFDDRARADIGTAAAALPAPGGWSPMAFLGVDVRVVAGPSLVVEIRAPAGEDDPLTIHDTDVAAAIVLLDDHGPARERTVAVVPGKAAPPDTTVDPSEDKGSLAPGAVRKIRLRPSTGRVTSLARIDGVLVRLR